MATLTVQEVVEGGLDVSYANAAAGGDVAPNDGLTMLHVKNAGGSICNITVTAQDTSKNVPGFNTMTRANITDAIAATTGDVMLGPFAEAFNNSSGQLVITYDQVVSVTIAAIRLPRAL